MTERFVLGPDQARERIDKVLARLLPDVSRSSIQRWIVEGRVLLDGRPCHAKVGVHPGNVIEVERGPSLLSRAEPDLTVKFGVLYEDPYLVVVDKPAGLVVHPGLGHQKGTLINGLLAREGFQRPPSDPLDPGGALRPGIVHRIDKDTSGILVVAKAEMARESLKAQLSSHSMERQYTAITYGVPKVGTIATLHDRHPKSRLRFTSHTKHGRSAVTHIERVEPLAAGRAAAITCRLETGRTHQIRVHLAEQCGSPILADALYSRQPHEPALAQIAQQLGRHALHAETLGFTHPVTGEALRFQVPLPADMQRALEELKSLG